jgi:hypothetical protein
MKQIYFIVIFLLPFSLFGQENWIIDKNGCKVFNPFPRKHESVEWSGKCKDSLAEGTGTLTWYLRGRKTKNVFEGNMVNGKQEGKGTYVYSDGTKLVGEFQNGYFYKGTKTEESGKTIYEYKGYFKNNEIEGKGELTVEGMYNYIGEFKNGMEHGSGIQKMSYDESFEGEFENGYYKEGKYKYNLGFTIEGKFKEFEPYYGTIYYSDSSKYIGDIRKLKPHGKGTLYTSDGFTLKGNWVKRTFHGQGEYILPNGITYKAKWVNGKIEGEGLIIYPNGKTNKGIFENGELMKEIEQ